MRAGLVALSVLAILAPPALVDLDAASAATPAQVVDVTAEAGPFVVAGWGGQAQSVISVVVDDPDGTIGNQCMDWYYSGFRARLQRTSGGAPTVVDVDLPRINSSAGRDVYAAPWRIASTRGGTWTVTHLDACANDPVSIDPRVTPGVTRTIAVVGSAPPTATIAYAPSALAYPTSRNGTSTMRQSAVLTYKMASGAPIVGARVIVGTEYACWDSPIPPTRGNPAWSTTTLVTDAAGRVVVRLTDLVPCVSLMGHPAVAGDGFTRALVRTDQPTRRYLYERVLAGPTATRVHVGRPLTVMGSASPAEGVVALQRLVGRTWRTLATARVRPSGRFGITATVAWTGSAYLRVVARSPWTPTTPVTYALVPTPSRSFVVVGFR